MFLPTKSQFLAFVSGPTQPLPADWTCPICMGSAGEERVVVAHAAHAYHQPCLTAWLQGASTCPECRQGLFVPETISTSRELTGVRDSRSLADLRGQDLYGELITAEEGEDSDNAADLVDFSLRETLRRLRRRVGQYRQGELIVDQGFGAFPFHAPSAPQPDQPEEQEERLHTLKSRPLAAALFASWWSTFTSTAGKGLNPIHHPLGSALLFSLIAALRSWEDQPRSQSSLELMLRIRLNRGFEVEFPQERYARPEGWEVYREALVGEAGRIFYGVSEKKEVLEGFEVRASQMEEEEEHKALWE